MQRHRSAVNLRDMFLLLYTSSVIAHARGSTNMTDEVLDTGGNHCQPIPVNGEMMPTEPEYMPSFSISLKGIKRHFFCKLSDDCLCNPCENGGSCQDGDNSYTCQCTPGWEGINCQIDTDECSSQPCDNQGICQDEENGYTCACENGWIDTHCETDVTINSLKLLGEKINEGTLALTSSSSPNTYVLVHQDHWNMNLSQLACQYLGFEGVFATVSSPLNESSSANAPAEAESVKCPANATNITDCWYSETKVGRINESEIISIVCCPVSPCNVSGQPLGLESGALPDSAFSESSCLLAPHCSRFGRLNSETDWVANSSDPSPWMQVQFESSYIVTAITTQGRNDYDEWVTSYTFSSSFDNTTWTDYLNVYSGSVKIFPGNYDRHSYVTHTLARPIVGRSFRIYPKTNHGYNSMRMELYGYGPLTDVIASLNLDVKLGCTPSVLGEGLGVEDRRIPDSSLTSSSVLGPGYETYRGRLNSVASVPGSASWITAGSWVAATSDRGNPWVKVDLGKDALVTGVITQGRPINTLKVTSVQISYSRDNTNWIFAPEEQCGVRKTYAANFDEATYVTILFPEPVTARYVTIHPVTSIQDWPSMRFEVLGINN